MKTMTFLEFARVREEEDWRLIDVRERDEWDAVHAVGAELHPLSLFRRGEFPAPDDRPVAVICASGGRSAMAAQILESRGWPEVANIVDGTMGAMRAGEEHVER